VEAYGAAIEPFMAELSKTVAADPTEAGIEKAAKLWESKKADLKGKLDAIDAAPQGKNADWRSLQMKINSRTREHLDGISVKVGGSPAESKFKQLRQDIDTTLKLK
ncbi:MAG TPA: hypothetical protein VNA17_01570, partial [Pyrinomonadaceae bacterium]|nr:hypothetical protein [Pyrinomonadaceae bacterium]